MKDFGNQIYIDSQDELNRYDLDGKWNDYIAVQKEVLRILKSDGFFNENKVRNYETNMMITISPKDIRETFGNGNKFQRLPKKLKEYKVATIGKIIVLSYSDHLKRRTFLRLKTTILKYQMMKNIVN